MNRLEAIRQGIGLLKPQPKPVQPRQPHIPHQEIVTPPNASLDPYTGPWTSNEATHLIKRTMFGAKKSDIDYFAGMTMSQAVDELLQPPATPPAPPLKYNSANASSLAATHSYMTTSIGDTWTTKLDTNTASSTYNTYIPAYENTSGSEQYTSLQAWWTKLMIEQGRSVVEKMVVFLHNLTPVEWGAIDNAYLGYRYSALLRSYALGNYKSFITDLMKDGAMMMYLGNYTNYSTAPNENYARELQELFTLGMVADAPGAYTNADVAAAAKVLTGHTFNYTTGQYVYNSARHTSGAKQFSSFYNAASIAFAGAAEHDALVNMIFAKDEAAKHIVRKLYRYFCYYKIDTTIEANVIAPLAIQLKANGYNLQPVLSTLFKSEHFYDVTIQGCIIKSPLDAFIGGIREFGMTLPSPTSNLQEYYQTLYYISTNHCAITGQQTLYPPDVAGWKAYRQEPGFHELWINTNTVQNRDKYLALLINGQTLYTFPFKVNVVAFAQSMSNPADPNILVADFVKYLFRADVSQAVKDTLKIANLLGGQTSDYYWTNAWNLYLSNTANTTNANVVTTRLKNLLLQLLKMAEYYLM